MTETAHTSTVSEQPPVTNIKVAQFVALLEEGSTLRSPKILIGQVHSFLDNAKVSLLWYKAHKNNYQLEIDGEQWIEDVNCCLPVRMTPVRNKPGMYHLNDSLRSIHKSFTSEWTLTCSLNFKGALSQYLLQPSTKLPFNWGRPENNALQR